MALLRWAVVFLVVSLIAALFGFGNIAEGTAEIAPRVLSRELKALAQTGLIDRKDYGVVPPKVEYRLTRKGRSFVPVIAAIRNWGARHLAPAGSDERPGAMAAE